MSIETRIVDDFYEIAKILPHETITLENFFSSYALFPRLIMLNQFKHAVDQKGSISERSEEIRRLVQFYPSQFEELAGLPCVPEDKRHLLTRIKPLVDLILNPKL